MSEAGVRGLQRTLDDVSDLVAQLSPEDWGRPSGAEGWTVKDVIWHMADLQVILTSALQGKLSGTEVGIEALNENRLRGHKTDTAEHVAGYFRSASEAAAPVFQSIQSADMASVEAPFIDLGTYPIALMPDVCSFDFLAHLRFDLLTPRGPLKADVPPMDEVRAFPAVRWLIAGIAQMQPDLGSSVESAFELRLSGPGGGRWVISPHGGDLEVAALQPDAPDCANRVESTAESFLGWATKRLAWADHVAIRGDAPLASWLNTLNLI